MLSSLLQTTVLNADRLEQENTFIRGDVFNNAVLFTTDYGAQCRQT